MTNALLAPPYVTDAKPVPRCAVTGAALRALRSSACSASVTPLSRLSTPFLDSMDSKVPGAKSLPKIWSGRRGSNPQPPAWEADALPLSYSRAREQLAKRIIPRHCL